MCVKAGLYLKPYFRGVNFRSCPNLPRFVLILCILECFVFQKTNRYYTYNAKPYK